MQTNRLLFDGQPLPHFSPSAARSVRDRTHARQILRAYWDPEIQHPCDSERWPDRDVRIAGDVLLVVCRTNGDVIAVAKYNPPPPDGVSPVLSPPRPPRRRRRGGIGNRTPTSIDELIERARKSGVCVRRSSRHWHLSVPGNPHAVTIASTASDYRAAHNATAQCRQVLGIDLRRDAKGE